LNKTFLCLASAVLLFMTSPSSASATPWAKNPTYASKTGGKLAFGLTNTLLGWTTMFVEAKQPEYKTDWEGFCVGISRSIFNTAAGLVQLATFPVPVDFPDVGRGIHIPTPAALEGGTKTFAKRGSEPAAVSPEPDVQARDAAMAEALAVV